MSEVLNGRSSFERPLYVTYKTTVDKLRIRCNLYMESIVVTMVIDRTNVSGAHIHAVAQYCRHRHPPPRRHDRRLQNLLSGGRRSPRSRDPAAAWVPELVAHVSRSDPVAGRPLPRRRPGSAGLRVFRCP